MDEPRYSSTNPRSYTDIQSKLSPEHAGYLNREPLPDDKFQEFYSSLFPKSRFGRAQTGTRHTCYQLRATSSGFDIITHSLTTAEIFRSKFVLPYSLSSTDYKKLTSQSGQYSSKFSPKEREHLYSKLKDYASELQIVSDKREVFKLTDTIYVDDLGRFYVRERHGGKFVWEYSCYNINFGRGQREFSRGVVSIILPLYGWTGLAGLKRDVKCRFLAEKNIDFHHVEENLWDIRPRRIIPLPVAVHRWVHSNIYTMDEYRYFFGDE